MAPHLVWLRKLLLSGGFAVAIAAAPVPGAFAAPPVDPGLPLATGCTGGEEEDTYTTVCTPMVVPNSGSPFTSIPGNPDIPAVALPGGGGAIPCTGHNSGECIGLAEEDAAEGPMPVPKVTISSSP